MPTWTGNTRPQIMHIPGLTTVSAENIPLFCDLDRGKRGGAEPVGDSAPGTCWGAGYRSGPCSGRDSHLKDTG